MNRTFHVSNYSSYASRVRYVRWRTMLGNEKKKGMMTISKHMSTRPGFHVRLNVQWLEIKSGNSFSSLSTPLSNRFPCRLS